METNVYETLLEEIKEFLVKRDLTTDVCIYLDKTRWEYKNGEWVSSAHDPADYFEYTSKLCMSFEGALYEIFNYSNWGGYGLKIEQEFSDLLNKHGFYYELGNSWNCKIVPQ